MAKMIKERLNRDSKKAARVKDIAELTGVSERYVRMVINGERQNEEIFRFYMQLAEGENLLLQEIKETILLNQ